MTEQLKRYRMHSPDGVAGAMTDMVLASDHAAAVAALEKERDEMRELLQEAYEQGALWRGDRIYKYVVLSHGPLPGEAR